MTRTRKLDFYEIRVLGVLLEKEQTTPDHYPMTINAVIAACNQKTNRDPVTRLTETEVVEALDRLRLDVLTWRSEGARVERWQHSLDRRWGLTSERKALMTLLLLRGPQTPGELKTRSERMHHFDSVAEVEEVLRGMSGGIDALVRELPRRPGQRESRWMHLTAADESAAPAEAVPSAMVAPSADPSEPPGPSGMERLETLEGAMEDLRATVTELRQELRGLRLRLGDLEAEE